MVLSCHDVVNHIAKRVLITRRRHLSYPMILSTHGSSYTYDYNIATQDFAKGVIREVLQNLVPYGTDQLKITRESSELKDDLRPPK